MSGRRSSSAEGTPIGMTGIVAPSVAGAMREVRRRLADQHRDRMLELGAQDAQPDLLRLSALQLRLSGDDVRLGGDADLVLVLRDLKRALVGLDGVGKQAVLFIRDAQLHVVDGERCLRRKPRGGQIRLARFGAGDVTLDRAADLAPDIEIPGGRRRRGRKRSAARAASRWWPDGCPWRPRRCWRPRANAPRSR